MAQHFFPTSRRKVKGFCRGFLATAQSIQQSQVWGKHDDRYDFTIAACIAVRGRDLTFTACVVGCWGLRPGWVESNPFPAKEMPA